MQLFHGSHETLSKIDDSGIFSGIFASLSEEVALSHAENLHVIDLNESEILTQHDLDYVLDYETVKKALIDALHYVKNISEKTLNRAWEIIIEEKQLNNKDFCIFNRRDFAESSWEAQKIRGQVAKNLGYKAIEMQDEHGISYHVNKNAKIKVIK